MLQLPRIELEHILLNPAFKFRREFGRIDLDDVHDVLPGLADKALTFGISHRLADDQIGNPTLAEYLAETTVSLVDRGVTGIVNVVGRDLIPRSDFARALVRLYGGDVSRVIPVSTASLKQKATRPLRGGLRTEKLEKLLGTRALSLEESLQRLRNQWQADPI